VTRSLHIIRSNVLGSMIVVLAACAAACGGSGGSPASPSAPSGGGSTTPTPGGTTPNGTLSATIDGVPWTATVSVQTQFNNGILSFAGGDNRQTLSIAVTANRGTGTYVAGVVDPQNIVVANLSTAGSAASWLSGPSLGTGSVTITSLTSTSASGTFTLTLAPSAGSGATGNKALTNGVFNVTFTIPPTLPPGAGTTNGTISALVDGAPWRGAVTARAANTGGFLSLTGQDTDTRLITMALPASVGVHSLAFGSSANAFMTIGGQQWVTATPGGTGSVTITTLTSTRVTGTFTMGMQPALTNPGARPSQVTNGVFDLAF
jgi:Family of unknown function (DUF6252)